MGDNVAQFNEAIAKANIEGSKSEIDDPIDVSITEIRTNYLRKAIVDILKNLKMTSEKFSNLFYEVMTRRREKLVVVGDDSALFEFPSYRQQRSQKDKLIECIVTKNRKLYFSYPQFVFIVEEMLQLTIPDDPVLDKIKAWYTRGQITPGIKVGGLTVLERAPRPEHLVKSSCKYWKCQDDQGNFTIVANSDLDRKRSADQINSGSTLSEMLTRAPRSHPLYGTWNKMIYRCANPRNRSYGISVCDRWKESFENFIEDMGDRPEGTTLDRKDNEGNYCKANCRWATRPEQARNTRRNRIIDGVSLIEWVERHNLNYNTTNALIQRSRKSGITDSEIESKLIKSVKPV